MLKCLHILNDSVIFVSENRNKLTIKVMKTTSNNPQRMPIIIGLSTLLVLVIIIIINIYNNQVNECAIYKNGKLSSIIEYKSSQEFRIIERTILVDGCATYQIQQGDSIVVR